MNAEELIIRQYELVKRRISAQKKAGENYSKCVNRNEVEDICFEVLISEIRNSGNRLDPDDFDSAVQAHCCKFCRNGWNYSKSIKATKKRLAGIKHSMHALAKRLMKNKMPNKANSADAKKPRG